MAEVDLHLHTTCSDGRLTPTQLVDLVASRGLKVVAITDHDSTEGLNEALDAAGKHPQLDLICGVEMSTDVPDGEIHILAYYVDRTDSDFQSTLTRFRESRLERGRGMVEKLSQLGMPISWERVLELAEGAVGRPHIALAMMEKGYVSSTQEAFASYLGRNGPAYVEREKLTPEEAVQLALQVGSLPVLAHPGDIVELERQIVAMKDAGLVGMEVYYGGYTAERVSFLLELARRYDLVPCGGSDYHAMGYANEVEPGSVGPPISTSQRLAGLKAEQVWRRAPPG